MKRLIDAAEALARAVDGVDWNAAQVDLACRRVLRAMAVADAGALDAALAILVDRLARGRVDDADGAAFAAISGGSLVERGADPAPLAEVLLARLPGVLAAARRFADGCLAQLGDDILADGSVDRGGGEGGFDVDDRRIPLALFRAQLGGDRGGGAALAYLRQWTLPAVAALTRCRPLLERATTDGPLAAAAAALHRSDAGWLHVLLGVELDARWRVLLPLDGRGFEVVVDGVVSNFDLHALIAAALGGRGVATADNPPALVAYLRSGGAEPPRSYVAGSWNLYGPGAAGFDLRDPAGVPQEHWVWGEGGPRDVPRVGGVATILLGPAAYERTWSAGRTFAALAQDVRVVRELTAAEVKAALAR